MIDSAPGASEPIRYGGSAEAVLAQVVSSGEGTLVVTAEAYRRWRALGATAIGRFRPGVPTDPRGFWAGSPLSAIDDLGRDLVVTDYESLALAQGKIGGFQNIVLFDPPASTAELALASRAGDLLHLPHDPRARAFALAASAERHDPAPALRVLFAALRDSGGLEGEDLRALLAGNEEAPRPPERAGMLIRVMLQAGIGRSGDSRPVREFGVVSSKEVNLESSAEFRRQRAIHEEQIAFLRR